MSSLRDCCCPLLCQKLWTRLQSAHASITGKVEDITSCYFLVETLFKEKQDGYLTDWSLKDLTLGLTAAIRLSMEAENLSIPEDAKIVDLEKKRLSHLLEYARMSAAVYEPNLKRICQKLNVEASSIVCKSLNSGMFEPVYLVLRDESSKRIIVVIRGTMDIQDVCADICTANEPFLSGHAHRGIVHCTKWLIAAIQEEIQQLMEKHPEYDLHLTGHSLGAGVASLACLYWKEKYPQIRAFCFATPACLTYDLATTCMQEITNVICGDDFIPRLSEYSLEVLENEVSECSMHESLWNHAFKLVKYKVLGDYNDNSSSFTHALKQKQLTDEIKATKHMEAQRARRKTKMKELSLPKTTLFPQSVVVEETIEKVGAKLQSGISKLKKFASSKAQLCTKVITIEEALTRFETKLTSGLQQLTTKTSELRIQEFEVFNYILLRFGQLAIRLTNLRDKVSINLSKSTSKFHLVNPRVDLIARQLYEMECNLRHAYRKLKVWSSIVPDPAHVKQAKVAIDPICESLLSEVELARICIRTLQLGKEVNTANLEDPDSVDEDVGFEELITPGEILHLHRTTREPQDSLANFSILHKRNDAFSHIVLSSTMVSDHGTDLYEQILSDALKAKDKTQEI